MSLSFARRSASSVDVTPAANTTCDRSDTATPALIGSSSRKPSAAARTAGTAVAERPLSPSSDESTLNLTITRAISASSTVEAPPTSAGPCTRKAANSDAAGNRL